MADKKKKKRGLDKHNPVPLYYQLMNLIDEKISSREYQPGEKIPSENELCEIYNISRTTVRQAINSLENMGKLIRTQGRGTFVAETRIRKPTYRMDGFNRDMRDSGVKPGTTVLQIAPVLPNFQARTSLQLNENEATVYLELLRFADDKVVGWDTSFLPFKRFSYLLDEDLTNKSLYHLLREKFGTYPMHYIYQIEAMHCPREIANHLEINPLDIVMHVYGVVYDQHNEPFEYSEEYYRADRYAFRAEVRVDKHESFGGVLPASSNAS